MNLQERFDSKWIPEPNSGCWLWTDGCNRGGYGRIAIKRRARLAHRVSYEFTFKEIPDGMCVLHRCDTPACVNPSHLFIGTRQDNLLDCNNKGRGTRKLSQDDIEKIKKDDRSLRAIAKTYGVTFGHIWKIKHYGNL